MRHWRGLLAAALLSAVIFRADLAFANNADTPRAEAAERFGDEPVPPPPHWGGLRVSPESVEFWQGRSGRLHDRLRYRRTTQGWTVERLAP